MVWIVLGVVAIALWVNFLDGPRIKLPPKPTAWQRAWAIAAEFCIKLGAVAAVGFAGYLAWKMLSPL